MSETVMRKAALLMSVLLPEHADRLLATQTPACAAVLRKALDEVRRQGWNQPALVEAALGLRLEANTQYEVPGVEDLLALAHRVDSNTYARVLTAAQMPDVEFLLSLLEQPYAERVRSSLQAAAPLPGALRSAVLAAASRRRSIAAPAQVG